MMNKLWGAMVVGIISSILAGCAGERPNNLGVRDGGLAACPGSPNCVNSRAADDRHRIAPLTFSDEPIEAFVRLKQTLACRSDTTIVSESPGYLRVEFRTTLFVDDGEFLMDPEQRTIHLRSASRLGYSDLGKNRSRMEEISREFEGSEVRP